MVGGRVEQVLAVVVAVSGVAISAIGLAAAAGRRRLAGVVAVRVDRWIFSGLLPVVFVGGILALALVALPWRVDLTRAGRLTASVVLSGVAAMVVIETVKRLLPLRSAYNRRQIALWFEERTGEGAVAMGQLVRAMDLAPAAEPVAPDERDPASEAWAHRRMRADMDLGRRWRRATLVGPGVGGAFNLPAEQLSAQIGAAAERASRERRDYLELITALCPGLSPEAMHELDLGLRAAGDRHDAAAEVAYGVTTAIDQLQIRLAGRWRHYLQVTAWWLTGLVALFLAVADTSPTIHSASFVVAALLFGGFFAWLARDLSAAVERWRR